MCKNKKLIAVLLGLGMTFSLAGCNLSETLVTDTGSGKQQEIPKEDYLKTDVLDGQKEQTVEDVYIVYTLEKGKFEEAALSQILRQSYINVPTVQFELEGIDAQFGEYVAEYFSYVEKGDVIATVYTEVDELALNEAKTRVQRLEERYRVAEQEYTEELEQLALDKHYCYDEHKAWIFDVRIRQRQLDWDYQKVGYENQIADAKKQLQKLTQVGSVYEITAPASGFISYNHRYPAGTELEEGAYICHLLESGEVYTSTNDQADRLHYGMQVNFNSVNGEAPAMVVNGGSWLLYGNLDKGNAIFKLDYDKDFSELNRDGLNNLVLKGNLKEMDNVIVIPKAAVTEENGEYYVTVLKEDGSLLKTEFLPGGSNVESYWVLEGLTEGTKIVYN